MQKTTPKQGETLRSLVVGVEVLGVQMPLNMEVTSGGGFWFGPP